MIIGKVIGNVTSSIKHPIFEGQKLLVIKPVIPPKSGKPVKAAGGAFVALDVVQAGVGDTVLVLEEGNSGRMILGDSTAPVRSIIAGIIDAVEYT